MIEIQKCYAVNGTKQEIIDEVFPPINNRSELESYRKDLLVRQGVKHVNDVLSKGETLIPNERIDIYFQTREK